MGDIVGQDVSVFLMVAVVLVLVATGVATLAITAKLYQMHNVKNQDGEYAWMIPKDFLKMQAQITKSQEMIGEEIAESSRNQKQVSKLLETLVNATLSLHQAVKTDGVNDGGEK